MWGPRTSKAVRNGDGGRKAMPDWERKGLMGDRKCMGRDIQT
jgi:hypothetical protein